MVLASEFKVLHHSYLDMMPMHSTTWKPKQRDAKTEAEWTSCFSVLLVQSVFACSAAMQHRDFAPSTLCNSVCNKGTMKMVLMGQRGAKEGAEYHRLAPVPSFAVLCLHPVALPLVPILIRTHSSALNAIGQIYSFSNLRKACLLKGLQSCPL